VQYRREVHEKSVNQLIIKMYNIGKEVIRGALAAKT
jgi:hypothetical protein